MTIFHISDSHGFHDQLIFLPSADIIVHSGDFTFGGSKEEADNFMRWFCSLPYKHKVLNAGNHDMCMYGMKEIKGLPDSVHYLCNSSVVIDGVKFYGVYGSTEIDGTIFSNAAVVDEHYKMKDIEPLTYTI